MEKIPGTWVEDGVEGVRGTERGNEKDVFLRRAR